MIDKKKYKQLIERAEKLTESCVLCPRQCKVDRTRGQRGFCGADQHGTIFKDFIHYGEEPGIVPSHTIYLTGCNLRCEFCSNMRFVTNPETGIPLDYAETASIIDQNFSTKKSINVNFLGGEPTINLPAILKILSHVKEPLPVIWNSNLYASAKAFDIVLEFADFFLADFKFGNNKCAEKISKTSNYFEIVTANLSRIDQEKMIIRHLPLPGHFDCCTKPVLEWIAANKADTPVSILSLFTPSQECSFTPLTQDEIKDIEKYATELNIKLVYPFDPDVFNLNPTDSSRIFETEILIRKDGSLVLQDISSDILKSVKSFTLK